MSIVPILRPREVVKALEKLGWEVVRQRRQPYRPDKERAYSYVIGSQSYRSSPWHVTKLNRKGRNNGRRIFRSAGRLIFVGLTRVRLWLKVE